jgi:hypothetical protein
VRETAISHSTPRGFVSCIVHTYYGQLYLFPSPVDEELRLSENHLILFRKLK